MNVAEYVAELLGLRLDQLPRMLEGPLCHAQFVEPEWDPVPLSRGAIWAEEVYVCELDRDHDGEQHSADGGKARWD